MPRLLARGPDEAEKRYRLRPDRVVRLGRAPSADSDALELFAVPWESNLSRDHAVLTWSRGRLRVRRLESAKNPIFYKGKEADSFEMVLGEHFVIGKTTFALAEDRASVAHEDPTPLEIVGYTLAEIREMTVRERKNWLALIAWRRLRTNGGR